MTWRVISAATKLLRSAFSNPARSETEPTSAESGHASPMFKTARRAGASISKPRRELRKDSKTYSARRAEKHHILARGVQ